MRGALAGLVVACIVACAWAVTELWYAIEDFGRYLEWWDKR